MDAERLRQPQLAPHEPSQQEQNWSESRGNSTIGSDLIALPKCNFPFNVQTELTKMLAAQLAWVRIAAIPGLFLMFFSDLASHVLQAF